MDPESNNASDDDDHYRTLLETKRLDIIQNLNAERTFVFDYLRSKSVLDAEDCELIQHETTTPRRIGKFVDILAKKGPLAYQYLLESLQLENPVLFKILTGKDANATTSPIMTKLKNSYLGLGGPLGNGELVMLSKHLEQTYGDLHKMSCRFEAVVQHKKAVEDQLETTIEELNRNQEKMENLQKKIDSKRGSSSVHHDHLVRCLQYVDTLRKDKSDRDIYIIALQTKLMSAKEEVSELQKQNKSLDTKNTALHRAVNSINENYKMNQCESLRMSERIFIQGGEIKKAAEMTRKYRECQFRNIKLQAENDRLLNDVNELQKCTQALKVRYDIVESEKTKTLSAQSAILDDFGNVRNELMTYKEEVSEANLVATDLEQQVRRLQQSNDIYKTQRDSALVARRDAILDRDKAYLERDQAVTKYRELASTREAAMDSDLLRLKSFDEVMARNDVMEEEMTRMRTKLRQIERELDETRMNCRLEENEDDGEESDSENATAGEDEDGTAGAQDRASPGDEKVETIVETKKLVDSVKRRVDELPELDSPERFEIPYKDLFAHYPGSLQESGGACPRVRRHCMTDDVKGLCRRKKTRKPVRRRPLNVDSLLERHERPMFERRSTDDSDYEYDADLRNVALDFHDNQP